MKSWQLLLLMLCYCIAEDFQYKISSPVELHYKDAHWDYLVFTQQWPQTVCFAWKDRNAANQCALTKSVDSWTVHGIWPSNITGDDPQFCNTTWNFNMTQLMPLLDKLEKYWPNLYAGKSQDDFWKHEWTKHGTCAASDTLLHGEYDYFNNGLELVKKYDLNIALESIGIMPSTTQSYKLSEIHSAITHNLGTNSSFSCYNHKKTHQYLIKEIRICLDKTLTVMDCPEELTPNLELDEFCPKDGVVFYPPIDFTTLHSSNQPDSSIKLEL